MRYVIALATLPAVTIWVATPPSSPEPVFAAKAVTTEGIREQRADATTFRIRWSLVNDLPPMKEIIHEPLLLVSHDTTAPMAPAAASIRPALSRKVALRTNVCARHGMRKVNYGKRWRCRR